MFVWIALERVLSQAKGDQLGYEKTQLEEELDKLLYFRGQKRGLNAQAKRKKKVLLEKIRRIEDRIKKALKDHVYDLEDGKDFIEYLVDLGVLEGSSPAVFSQNIVTLSNTKWKVFLNRYLQKHYPQANIEISVKKNFSFYPKNKAGVAAILDLFGVKVSIQPKKKWENYEKLVPGKRRGFFDFSPTTTLITYDQVEDFEEDLKSVPSE